MLRMVARIVIGLVVLGVSSASATDPPAGGRPGPFVVKDANGAVLGTYLGETDNGQSKGAFVIRTVGTKAVWFKTTPEFEHPDGDPVFFASADCTGTAYVRVDRANTFATFGVIVGGGPRLYYQTGPELPPTETGSYLYKDTNCPAPNFAVPPLGCCNVNTSTYTRLAPATMDDLSALVPPLRVGE